MKRKVALGILILGLGCIAALTWLTREAQHTPPLTLYGNVDIREVDMAFRQSGRIVRLYVDEGAQVRRGDLLAELDAQNFLDALTLAQAQQAQAVAELDKLRRGNRSQEITQAYEAERQAQSALWEAEQQYERQTALRASGYTSQRNADTARSARDQAAASLTSAQARLSLLREGARREDIAAAQAKVQAAQAQVAQARTAVADAQLFAPSDAQVSVRVREVGSMVGANAPVYVLSLQEPAYVRAYVSQSQLTRVQPGREVLIRVDGTPQTLQGTVSFISPKAEFTPKSVETTELRTELVYRIRIAVPGGSRILRQGMPVTVEFAEANLGA